MHEVRPSPERPHGWACGEQSKIGAEPGADLVRLTKQAASKLLQLGCNSAP
jgi:hypothetical protein